MAKPYFAIERPRKIHIAIEGYDPQGRTQAQQRKQQQRRQRLQRRAQRELEQGQGGSQAQPMADPEVPVDTQSPATRDAPHGPGASELERQLLAALCGEAVAPAKPVATPP